MGIKNDEFNLTKIIEYEEEYKGIKDGTGIEKINYLNGKNKKIKTFVYFQV